MLVSRGNLPEDQDYYIDYPFEEVMFRWDHVEKKVYRRFYGESEFSKPIPIENRLYRDALRFGDQAAKEKYEAGVSRPSNSIDQ